MTTEDILIDCALELKYTTDAGTRDQIKALYVGATGKLPKPRQNLLNWFRENYKFDGIDTWYHIGRSLPN